MYLVKLRSVNKILLKLRIDRCKLFKTDTILSVISSLTYLVANLLFWYLINNTGFLIDGWSYSDILVFIAYSELFFGLESAIFSVASRFWFVVHSGSLDVNLSRPLDPRFRFILLNMDYIKIITTFITFIVIILISKQKINIFMHVLGILIVMVSNFILMLIRFTMSYMSFWFGKMDAISELADCLTWFNKYPLTIMPNIIKIVFKILLPFYFFSTFSTEAVLNKLTMQTAIIGCLGLISNIIIWIVINNYVWKKGREKYESING
ncbi:ABC-2 family transporter protein [Sedimentibacter sp. zth1]|uniref:ABC-2 family transporter protein n=1 Tax=Sedimentibacter sp. zth1 TaxID=2816908 RepID=UPI001A922FA1|nr:ABC-2 family transporter protein [Sedimentibacter sp. zth1]QSX05004.1 ABC-2 family transporter protein [Sedimentibacter sp. zth1]